MRRAGTASATFIRAQRELANLSMRQLADIAKISNPYLSQVERGLYKPSADVLKQIANALHLSAETMYVQAGLLDEPHAAEGDAKDLEAAIRLDPKLSRGPERHPDPHLPEFSWSEPLTKWLVLGRLSTERQNQAFVGSTERRGQQ